MSVIDDRLNTSAHVSQSVLASASLPSRREVWVSVLAAVTVAHTDSRMDAREEQKEAPQEFPVFSWTVDQRFGRDGQTGAGIVGRPHALEPANVLNCIITSVKAFKELHGGEFPDDTQLVVSSIVTNREFKRTTLRLSQIPDKVTPVSLKLFSRDPDARRTFEIFASDYMGVQDSKLPDGKIQYRFIHWRVTPQGERVRNHIRLSLEKIKP